MTRGTKPGIINLGWRSFCLRGCIRQLEGLTQDERLLPAHPHFREALSHLRTALSLLPHKDHFNEHS